MDITAVATHIAIVCKVKVQKSIANVASEEDFSIYCLIFMPTFCLYFQAAAIFNSAFGSFLVSNHIELLQPMMCYSLML